VFRAAIQIVPSLSGQQSRAIGPSQVYPLIGFGAWNRPRDLRRDRAAARAADLRQAQHHTSASGAPDQAHRLPPRPPASVPTTGHGASAQSCKWAPGFGLARREVYFAEHVTLKEKLGSVFVRKQ
jgi:hypothetical protein